MIYIAFIDFEKAFDSFHRKSLWRILHHYRISQKMVNVIKILEWIDDLVSLLLILNIITSQET